MSDLKPSYQKQLRRQWERYRFGQRLCEVTVKSGAHAVAKAAEEYGIANTQAYRWCAVARLWDEQEFGEMLNKAIGGARCATDLGLMDKLAEAASLVPKSVAVNMRRKRRIDRSAREAAARRLGAEVVEKRLTVHEVRRRVRQIKEQEATCV